MVLQGRETLLGVPGARLLLRDDFRMADGGPAPEAMKDYGLVVVALERAVRKDSPRLQWLAQVKAPLMLVLY